MIKKKYIVLITLLGLLIFTKFVSAGSNTNSVHAYNELEAVKSMIRDIMFSNEFISFCESKQFSSITIAVIPQNLPELPPTISEEISKVENLVTSELGNYPNVILVERKEIEKILQEHKLIKLGWVDDSTREDIGKFLKAQAIIMCNILDLRDYIVYEIRLDHVSTAQIIKTSSYSMLKKFDYRMRVISESYKASVPKTTLALDTTSLFGTITTNGFGFPKSMFGVSPLLGLDIRFITNIPRFQIIEEAAYKVMLEEPQINIEQLQNIVYERVCPTQFWYVQLGTEKLIQLKAGIGILKPVERKIENQLYYDFGVSWPLILNLGIIYCF